MLSSISSSEQRSTASRTTRSIGIVLLGILLIGGLAEVGARIALGHISRVQRRIDQEYRAARSLQPYSSAGKPTMLVIGNSLLLEGVNFESLRSMLAAKYDVHRLVMEQTGYLDLYYILQTMFHAGGRPHEIVVCLPVIHLIGDETRGEFTARYLDAADVNDLTRREHLDATTTTNYFFAHWSAWFGTRVELRKLLLARVVPDVANLTTVLGFRVSAPVSVSDVLTKSRPRLLELKALCDQYHAQCSILIPPSLTPDHADALVSLGRELGVRVIVPVEAGGMDKTQFKDGFHLTPAAAEIFTAKVNSELQAGQTN